MLCSRSIFCALITFCFYSSSGFSSSLVKLEDIKLLKPLKGQEGYLLIEVDVGNNVPSLDFYRLNAGAQLYLMPNQKAKKVSKTLNIKFKGLAPGFYAKKIHKGLYQISQVNAPSFDLPYRLNTEKQRQWRFSIEKGAINYVGKLVIEKERSSNYVEMKLINRFAESLSRVDSKLENTLFDYPLRLGVGVRDDFFMELNEKVEK